MNQFVFNEIHPFKSDDKKWGYKKDHKIIIEPLYQGAMPFHDDICWVKQIAWGAIDIKKIISFHLYISMLIDCAQIVIWYVLLRIDMA
jgi:hypothetical protein